MKKELLMGNEAMGLGALRAGVSIVAGYPGTPSTEVLETIAKHNDGSVHVEWSVNEKAAMEVAAAASYNGARSLITMKQVGLNVAADPLMSLTYIGIKGGMVMLVADDPGPISSQTEQDTRRFGQFAKLPVFDPTSPEEAYEMMAEAYDISERYHTPVLFRPTTRICHSCASVTLREKLPYDREFSFDKDPKWVIFPKLAYENHKTIERQMPKLGEEWSGYARNTIEGTGTKGIITGGISYQYVKEALRLLGNPQVRVCKITTPHPFPEKLGVSFLKSVTDVLAVEELDPMLEDSMIQLCGKYHLPNDIYGKRTQDVICAGENSVESVKESIARFLGLTQALEKSRETAAMEPGTELPPLPVRPPVLCAGCPHRASFYAVKKAMEGQKSVFCGDIGCYTLGNAQPLDTVDTCLCMGADVTMAQGFYWMDRTQKCFAFIGDSTFFASGMTGVVNAVYNQAEITLIVLDNSTTAMTGHQPHPGTGHTMMGDVVNAVDITKILEGIGLTRVVTANPLELEQSIQLVREVSSLPGVKAIIFKSPCIAVTKTEACCEVDSHTCIQCKKCIRELGCPALVLEEGKVAIEPSLCTGCGLCQQVCPVQAIKVVSDNDSSHTEGK